WRLGGAFGSAWERPTGYRLQRLGPVSACRQAHDLVRLVRLVADFRFNFALPRPFPRSRRVPFSSTANVTASTTTPYSSFAAFTATYPCRTSSATTAAAPASWSPEPPPPPARLRHAWPAASASAVGLAGGERRLQHVCVGDGLLPVWSAADGALVAGAGAAAVETPRLAGGAVDRGVARHRGGRAPHGVDAGPAAMAAGAA